jgi:hypothetical protein
MVPYHVVSFAVFGKEEKAIHCAKRKKSTNSTLLLPLDPQVITSDDGNSQDSHVAEYVENSADDDIHIVVEAVAWS